MSSIRFVAVPQPAGTVSVLVVPRLTGAFVDSGMAEWAADLAGASLEIAADPGSSARVRVRSTPDADLWRRTFPPGTVVVPPVLPDYGDVRVDPSSQTLDRVSETYAASARAIASDDDPDSAVREALAEWDADAAAEGAAPGSGEWTELDFHRTVSLLREHPAVLRALGLVFDVDPPAGLLGASGRLRVTWPGNDRVTAPWTAYERTIRGFAPAAAGDIAGGMVDASTPAWRVTSLDLDGASGRLRDAARAQAVEDGSTPTLPALRSQGLALLRAGRGEELARRRDAGARRNAGGDALDETLTAEDLVLGYRVDVRRQGGPWRPVTSRLATYRLNGTPVGGAAEPEDAHIKANTATRQGSGALRADEIVARWDGWSLAVPPEVTGREPEPRSRRHPLPFDFEADLAVAPGSLPALRFGEDYRLRIRVADVTGGGPSADAPEGDVAATEYTTHVRYEPVLPPVLSADEPIVAPGEALDELVIRSDRGIDVAAFSAQHPDAPATVRRVFSPPQTSLRIADQHGALDDVTDDTLRDAAARGTIDDPAAGGVLLVVRDEAGTEAAGASLDEDWAGAWPGQTTKALRLSAPEPGRPRLEWRDGAAHARLAPGEQITLDVSSFLADGMLAHLAISEWLKAFPASAVTTGRHPMATPALPVRLVHAVRRPLADPGGVLEPERIAGVTRVTLTHAHPVLGVHVPTTAQIDLRARWEEWADAPEPTPASATLPPVELARGTTVVPAIPHDFADTKHRRVTYTATAVSRFRRYFPDDETPEAFLAPADLPEVSIPSAAPPPRPLVRSVSPAFRWSGRDLPTGWTRLERRRTGGLLRVELARPWFETGEGERLAVLAWDAAGPPTPTVEVTRVGRDPIRATGTLLTFPPLSVFAGASAPTYSLDGVTAVPYDVWFADDRWWADVAVPGIAAASYSPLVQLVVARYQAESLEGMRLSEPVRTDPVPLLPDRTLVVERGGASVAVVLSGTGTPANRVRVSIERAGSSGGDATDVRGDGAGWRAVGDETTGSLGARLDVPLPTGGGRMRLVVRETEELTGSPSPGIPAELAARTVFLDEIPL